MRRVGPFLHGSGGPERSLFFWHHSAGKRSLQLDLRDAAGRQDLRRLIASCDVLVETFPPGTLTELGLAYSTLAAANPELVLVSITPFGQTGPYHRFRGSDLICQAMGGMVAVNGDPTGTPIQGHGLPAYYAAGLHGALGALLALAERHRTGRGRWLDVSIQASVVSCLEQVSSRFVTEGIVSRRQGALHCSRDFRVGPAEDGHIVHSTLGDWTTLIEWLKADGMAEDLAEDPQWADPEVRRARCPHFFDILDRWSRRHAAESLAQAAQLRRWPLAAVRSPTALANDPHLAERDHFVALFHPHLDTVVRFPRPPFRFGRTPCPSPRLPPVLGSEAAAGWNSRPARSAPMLSGDGATSAAVNQALAGIRVIDFTWVIAGPLATRQLSDFGAEVIKVERIGANESRTARSLASRHLDRGKRSLAVDLTKPEGLNLVRRLISRADVVIDNFSARVMENFGLHHQALIGLRRDLITVNMPGFGLSGPYRDFVSYGPTLQALTGHTWLMRAGADGPPLGWGFSYSDMVAGYTTAVATLAALYHRRLTGSGQHVEVSQYEALVATLGPTLLAALNPTLLPAAPAPFVDNASQEMPSAPHGVFRCADLVVGAERRDRWCAIAVFGDAEWERLRRVMGDPDWAAAARLQTFDGRFAAQATVHAGIEEWTRGRVAEDVMRTLQAEGIAAGLVAEADDLLRRDPQLGLRHFWPAGRGADARSGFADAAALALPRIPARISHPAPRVGAHTDSVLLQILGLARAEIKALRARGIIA